MNVSPTRRTNGAWLMHYYSPDLASFASPVGGDPLGTSISVCGRNYTCFYLTCFSLYLLVIFFDLSFSFKELCFGHSLFFPRCSCNFWRRGGGASAAFEGRLTVSLINGGGRRGGEGA